jgi:tRNA(Ile)-lysidine synthase
MKWISPSPADAKIKLARPLLDVSKAELETFARENKIRFREDASNATLDFQRNRIRRELLPLLRRDYSPALDKLVLRAMDIVGAESEFVAAAARGDARPTTKKVFTKLAVALQRRVLQGELIARGIAPEFALIERLRSESGAAVSVAPGCAVSRAASGKVRLHKSPAENFSRGRAGLKLGAAGVVSFGGAKISWAIERQRMFRRPTPAVGREFFDADKVGARIVLRHWRPGDRFQPIGMKSAVKLQDLFVNAKIPRERRRELILATTARGEIFWVEGVRMGERFKLTSETGRKLRWEWLRGADSFGCGG